MFCSCDASHASFRKLSDVLPSLCAHSCMFMVSSKPSRPPQIFRKIFKRNFRTGNLLLSWCCKMLIKGWRKKHNSILCVFGLKVELYRASTYCRQCLTQKMQSNCNRRGGCIILKISPCHWSAPAVKTALEPTITFWPRRSSGWNVSSFADILHWRRRLWSARHPPLMIRCENCVCSTVCKECQSLSTVTGDKSHYWAQLLHSSSLIGDLDSASVVGWGEQAKDDWPNPRFKELHQTISFCPLSILSQHSGGKRRMITLLKVCLFVKNVPVKGAS